MKPERLILLDGIRNVQVEVTATDIESLRGGDMTACNVLTAMIKPLTQGIIDNTQGLIEGPQTSLAIDADSDIPATAVLDPVKFGSICTLLSDQNRQDTVLFITPKQDGYVIRSDLLEDRLRGCLGVRKVVSLVKARDFVASPPATAQNLAKTIESALCCILLDSIDEGFNSKFSEEIHSRLRERLSLPWLSPTPIPLRRLAVVGEVRPAHLSLRFFQAARALGVEVIALGPPGHWLQSIEPDSPYRHAFIELDLTLDPGLPDRIVTAVNSFDSKVDGITTVTEYLLIPVAQAAERLGLRTSPSTSFMKSVNKYQTRLADNPSSCRLVSGLEALRADLASGKDAALPTGPPWIVKPCNGWHSLGVVRVATKERLVAAVERVATQVAYSRDGREAGDNEWKTDVLIEEYCDGPEVDCNFVLWNGEILFFEVIDNFPCDGDTVAEDRQTTGNFKETQLVFPSALPLSEVKMLRASLYNAITRLGFLSGVFHVEARLRNSSTRYRVAEDGETIDFGPSGLEPEVHPTTVFLIEINARPPGYLDTCASYFANGVDLFALQILIALGDETRSRALSKPFLFHLHVVISAIQAKQSGIISSEDPWKDLTQKNPSLMDHVVQHVMGFEQGDRIQNPELDTTPWLSAFTAYSLRNRADLLRISSHIKREFECKIG